MKQVNNLLFHVYMTMLYIYITTIIMLVAIVKVVLVTLVATVKTLDSIIDNMKAATIIITTKI